MKLTGKQKRFLRAMGSTMEPMVQVGKFGIKDSLITQTDEVIEIHELIKIKVLNNSTVETKEAAEVLAARTNSALVQIIGNTILLYRQSEEKPEIELPN